MPPERYDLAGTLGALALIQGDPTLAVTARQVWWSTRTPAGPGTLQLARVGGELVATGYGLGAAWLVEHSDAIAGLRDDVTGFAELAARHPLVRRLAREHSGLRIPTTGRLFHHLVPAILGQKVTGKEAHQGYVGVLRHFAEPVPGPDSAARPLPSAAPRLSTGPGPSAGPDDAPVRLRLPPEPATVAATPYWVFHPFGIEQRRADTLRRAAARVSALEASIDSAQATQRLTALTGIGPWTAAEVVRVCFGDADAVSVGDYHIKNTVGYALAGEARATDERMLELLEPFRGHRGRVCRLLALAAIAAPRFGPRFAPRSFARF